MNYDEDFVPSERINAIFRAKDIFFQMILVPYKTKMEGKSLREMKKALAKVDQMKHFTHFNSVKAWYLENLIKNRVEMMSLRKITIDPATDQVMVWYDKAVLY